MKITEERLKEIEYDLGIIPDSIQEALFNQHAALLFEEVRGQRVFIQKLNKTIYEFQCDLEELGSEFTAEVERRKEAEEALGFYKDWDHCEVDEDNKARSYFEKYAEHVGTHQE